MSHYGVKSEHTNASGRLINIKLQRYSRDTKEVRALYKNENTKLNKNLIESKSKSNLDVNGLLIIGVVH